MRKLLANASVCSLFELPRTVRNLAKSHGVILDMYCYPLAQFLHFKKIFIIST